MKNNFNFSKYKQLQSISDYLNRDPGYDERRIRRWFSQTFYTPLEDVYKLPWDFVYQNYNEATLDELEYNQVYDLACEQFIEEFADKREIEDAAFARGLRAEQEETLKKKEAKKNKKKSKKGKKSQSLDSKPQPDSDIKNIKIDPINLNFED